MAVAVIIELFGKGNGGDPIRYTCANTPGIPKGTLLQISADKTVSAHSGADQPFAGIAAHEKVASDGATTIAVYTNGVFDITAAAAGATGLGAMTAVSATANMTTAADGDDLLQYSHVGFTLEAQSNDEVAAIRIRR